MLNTLRFFKNLFYFLFNILDFKLDFPVPPKNPRRMLSFHFWNSMLQIYHKRKQHQKRKSQETANIVDIDIKSFWEQADFKPPTYSDWLKTAMSKTYGVVVWPEVFKKIVSECESFFEAGCGSGLSSQCLISFIIEQQLTRDNAPKVTYHGVDLSEGRVVLAQKYIQNYSMPKGPLNLFCHFEKGDLEKIEAKDQSFDVSFIPSVLERVSDSSVDAVVEQVCRVTKKYIFVSDFFDQYPDGWPRNHQVQAKIFKKYGFDLSKHRYHMTETARNQCELQMLFERSN